MAETQISNVDEYGFKRPDDFDYAKYSDIMCSYISVLVRRNRKWHQLTRGNKRIKHSKKIKRFIQKGIPYALRPQVWSATSGADDLRTELGGSVFYNHASSAQLDPDVIHAIRMDLPRTYTDNLLFLSEDGCQEELFRILTACAADNKHIGYCQGLNYVAGMALLATRNEEMTFWLVKVLIERILPSDYYSPNMAGLITDINIFEDFIKAKFPLVHQHVIDLGVPWSCLVMKWFVCLYAGVLPPETVMRIWDCLFYQRSNILFKVAITLINHHRENILKCKSFASLTRYLKAMQSDMFVLDCHSFMTKVIGENAYLRENKLRALREDYKNKVKKEE